MSPESIAMWAVLALVALGTLALAWLGVSRSIARREEVISASTALRRLAEINDRFRATIAHSTPLRVTYSTSVNSKSKLDHFDLSAFLRMSVLDDEARYMHEVAVHEAIRLNYRIYEQAVSETAQRWLGKFTEERLQTPQFQRLEAKLYRRQTIPASPPVVSLTATVRYTSPKGQNSYRRSLEWDLPDLRDGLRAAQEARAVQSTNQYMRQRERSMVTPSVRMDTLKRDGFRCRMCGASAAQGTNLHIDHILPISRGGLSTQDNLQTLCETCNLGKGNRFVG